MSHSGMRMVDVAEVLERCQPDCRPPMFQFALPRPLFALTYHSPAMPALFKLPKPRNSPKGMADRPRIPLD